MAQGKPKMPKSPRKGTPAVASEKRTYFKQADFPQTTLQQAQKIASAIVDNFASDGGSPPDIALALAISPTSSAWPALAGASIAYGLTEGGVNANTIKLTPLGRKLVAPQKEGEDLAARREAILKPRILKGFFERYRRAKLPNDTIASNILKSLNLPADRVQSALEIIKVNGRYAGIIRETPTGPFVNLDSPGVPAPAATPELPEHETASTDPDVVVTEAARQTAPSSQVSSQTTGVTSAPAFDAKLNRVFISHGKQKAIVAQIKELLTFGSFEPVVSVERESTAIPVPEKVFEDMRSCGAGVLHVGAELRDPLIFYDIGHRKSAFTY